jgi:hypothetical protein
MSAVKSEPSRILADEVKSRSAPRLAAGAVPVKTPSVAAEGLYKPGFPHGLGLLGIRPMGLDQFPGAEHGFAVRADLDGPDKGKNLDLFA